MRRRPWLQIRASFWLIAIRFPFGVSIFRDLFHGAAAFDRLIVALFRNWLRARSRFQNQPLIFLFVAPNPNERPLAFGFFAFQNEMQLAVAQGSKRLLTVSVVGPPVPHHHGSAAVISLRNYPLEIFVLDGMIFHFHAEMFFTLLPGQPFRDCPRLENTVHLQPKIVMQTAGIMLLNDETRCAANLFW